MVAKLKSVIRTPILQLALKTALFMVALGLMRFDAISWQSGALFVAITIFLYVRPMRNALRFLPSILTILTLSFIIPDLHDAEKLLFVFLGALFFSVLSIKESCCTNIKSWYYFVHFCLVIMVTGLFLSEPATFFGEVVLVATLTLLFFEFYGFLMPSIDHRKRWLISGVITLIALELLWLGAFLPLSFIAVAALVTLVIFVLHDASLLHFHGALSRGILVRNISAAAVLSLCIVLFT